MVIYHGLPRLRCWGFWRTLQAKGEDDGQWSTVCLAAFVFLTENIISHEIFISHGMHGTHGIYRCAMVLDMMTGEHDFCPQMTPNFFIAHRLHR